MWLRWAGPHLDTGRRPVETRWSMDPGNSLLRSTEPAMGKKKMSITMITETIQKEEMMMVKMQNGIYT